MDRNGKIILGVVLGVVVAVVLFCLIVCIGCASNGFTFGQQIVEWFTATKEVIPDVVEETEEAVSAFIA